MTPLLRPGRYRRIPGTAAVAMVFAVSAATPPASGSAGQATPALGAWTQVAPPTAVRGGTATTLPGGTVLAVGAGAAELFDPVARRWRPTAAPPAARGGHTATLLSNGEVLTASGDNRRSAERYDPRTGQWKPTGELSIARVSGHTATLLPDGKVLVAGGVVADPQLEGPRFVDSAELYDPTDGTWRPTGAMTFGRAEHTATLLDDGMVLVVGGRPGELERSLNAAEVYDPASGTWDTVPRLMNAQRARHTASLLPDGTVLVAGGTALVAGPARIPDALHSSTERYNPRTRSWETTAPMSAPRMGHTATTLGDRKVLVVGGFTGPTGLQPLASTELFDPVRRRWAGGPGLAEPLAWRPVTQHAAAALDRQPCGGNCGDVLVVAAETLSALLYRPGEGGAREAGPARRSDGSRTPLPVVAALAGAVLVVGLALMASRRRRRPRPEPPL